MTDDPYIYPGTTILRNKLDIRDKESLNTFERRMTTERAAEGIPAGDFDLAHLQAIHRHLFQDVYDWAGELRTVDISKGGQPFIFRQYIHNGMADVHRRIIAANYFEGASLEAFAVEAGSIMGDVNYVHPFREGNGRTQLFYLKQLSVAAGHALDLRYIDSDAWIEASKRAHQTDYDFMSRTIRAALDRSALPPPVNESLADKIRAAARAAEREESTGEGRTDRGRTGGGGGGRGR